MKFTQLRKNPYCAIICGRNIFRPYGSAQRPSTFDLRLLTIFLFSLFTFHFSSAQPVPMTPETLWKFGRVSDAQVSPDGTMVLFGVTAFDIAANSGTRDLFVLPVAGGEAINVTNSSTSESSAQWRPDGAKIGFINSQSGSAQLWEMNPDGSSPVQVSSIEGGITGFGYAPDMLHVYFTKQVKVLPETIDRHPDLPMANALVYDDLMYRHWDSWADAYFNHVFVASYDNGRLGQATDIMENEPYDTPVPPFGGSAQIVWTPDGKALAYVCKKLSGKDWAVSTNTDIYLYDLESRQTTNLTAFNPGYDKHPAFSPDGRYMAWESMATPGFEADKTRIMILELETGLYRDFSDGFDQSSSSLAWAADSRTLYFVSGIHATYQLYALDLERRDIRQITKGHHDYQSVVVATSGGGAARHASESLVALRMSQSMPTEVFRVNPTSGDQQQLSFINREVLSGITMGDVEERWVKTTDDKEMLVWVVYPPDFDPSKKYPALLFCGGGPQNAISQFFSYRWNFQLMASQGYIVVAPNRRGVPSFGQAWNDQISQDYGGQNKLDLLSAIDALKQEPYVDENRLAAVGASYGGYSVFWLAGNHQQRFSAFIAHCGMFNFESWYGITEEMFFANHDMGGAYWEEPRPRNYDFSPHHFVGNWDTPILVIHGAKDYRVPYSQGMEGYNAAQLRGIPSRFLFFPDENHWVLRPQNSILWQREFFGWLDKWLKS